MTGKRYSPEDKDRAIRLLREQLLQHPSESAAINSVAVKIGCSSGTIRNWLRQAQIDAGERPGIKSEDKARVDLVRASRDGDQFHYHWAARQCLFLLGNDSDLAAVTIEGVSGEESVDQCLEAGTDQIDIGLYFGSESRTAARRIRYLQLKHSTHQENVPWNANGLAVTLRGFAERYSETLKHLPCEQVAQRYCFEFLTNRPISQSVIETLADLKTGQCPRHPKEHKLLASYTKLASSLIRGFFELFSVECGEPNLWAQRNLLARDLRSYLPDRDADAPIRLKELVTRKATSEFASNRAIRRVDVLSALAVTEEDLFPAPCRTQASKSTFPREQEQDLLKHLLNATTPVIIHAAGGVGKSILSTRLASSMPKGSEAVLYDCFGEGLYRTAGHLRHRHKDGLVQIANELSTRGLCHPLIPSPHTDINRLMSAFQSRLSQAVTGLRSKTPDASLCIILDAADNAAMAAQERSGPPCFIRDLLRTPLPEGTRLAVTCRSHRQSLLDPPPEIQRIELRPFSKAESARHLRLRHPEATDSDADEFDHLTNSNPRVQAMVLEQDLQLSELLLRHGPEPTTVDDQICELLEGAAARLRDAAGPAEAPQLDLLFTGLATLRPPVPTEVLATLAAVPESAVRSFTNDFGPPIHLRGNSIQFLDEPTETWFLDRFRPDAGCLVTFIERLRPLAATSAYVAAALPPLLLQAERLDELVDLALSGRGLPTSRPLEKRDVEMQRLVFALGACLRNGNHLAAAKLALKAGGESAGEQRQNEIIQGNTDLAARFLAAERLEEIVSRRTFSSGWQGAHHAYSAGLLSGCNETRAEAASRLRMALDWHSAWRTLPDDDRRTQQITDADIAEIAIAMLRLQGPSYAARFIRTWRPRRVAREVGQIIARRLFDNSQSDDVDSLATAAGNDIFLLLGLAIEAQEVGHNLPRKPLHRLLRLLNYRRVDLSQQNTVSDRWSWLYAINAAIRNALRYPSTQPEVAASILQRHLPESPPSWELTNRHGSDRLPMLRAYALDAALRCTSLSLIDVTPEELRLQAQDAASYRHGQEIRVLQNEVEPLMQLCAVSAEIACGRVPEELAALLEAALTSIASAERSAYNPLPMLRQAAALELAYILKESGSEAESDLIPSVEWLTAQLPSLQTETLISLVRSWARNAESADLALNTSSEVFQRLDASREEAESRTASMVQLARAILPVNRDEAQAYFDRAVSISSRIGDENLDRYSALLHLARAAGERNQPRAETAYRLARVAELTYQFVYRDKHFDWEGTVEALAALCPASSLAILSRWRDRRFGDPNRLLLTLIYRLRETDSLPSLTPLALSGLKARWRQVHDLHHYLGKPKDPALAETAAQAVWRYLRISHPSHADLTALSELGATHGLEFTELERLRNLAQRTEPEEGPQTEFFLHGNSERSPPDWDALFLETDPTDANDLSAAYERLHALHPFSNREDFFRAAVERLDTGTEAQFIRTVSMFPDFGLFRLRSLLDALPSPIPKLLSFREALSEAILVACQRDPQFVQRDGWGAVLPIERLCADGVVCENAIIRATLAGFADRLTTLGSREFFRMLDPLAASLQPEAADEAVRFGFDLLDEHLLPEDGDGRWGDHLQPPSCTMASLAGYIWAGLGSPNSDERWQFSHVVRTIIELNWSDLIDALVARARSGAPGPFVDPGLEFYVWHARQWLLIGLARGGMANSSALAPATPLLLESLESGHVLIREFAARALQTLNIADGLSADQVRTLETVNQPVRPLRVTEGWCELGLDEESETNERSPKHSEFTFEPDIGPYWFAPLGRAFGLSKHSVTAHICRALQERFDTIDILRANDARYVRRIFREGETHHMHGGMPLCDDCTAYQAYHAMMFTAAALLRTHRVRRQAEETTHEFRDWLAGHLLTYSNGLWLSDRRDPRFLPKHGPSFSESDGPWTCSVTRENLDTKLRADDGLHVLWGHWDDAVDDRIESVSVRSALVPQAHASALVAALQTATELGRFVLRRWGDDEDLEFGSFSIKGWVVNDSLCARLDEFDSWNGEIRAPGIAPSEEIVTRLGLTSTEDGRTWSLGESALLRSEAWSEKRGYGREEQWYPGSRLCANDSFLQALIAAHPGLCLVLSVEIRRRSSHRSRSYEGTGFNDSLYARYYQMGADGAAQAL